MRAPTLKLLVLFLLAPLTISVTASFAQDVCPQIVQQALDDLGPNCETLERNAACYGYNRVGATFNETQPDDFFSAVSDRAPLNILDTLETTPLNAEAGTWGVAVMKVQANVPNSLPGQAVTFILFGDAEVRNDVPAGEAFTPADPVDVITVGNVNVRSGASANSNVIGSVTDGTTMSADGRSENGLWLRIIYNNAPAWISAGLVIAPPEAANLPTLTQSLQTPMQAFHVTTGVNQAACQDAPDVLLVQGPDSMKINLTVNGADVQIGSTIAIRSGQIPAGELANNQQISSQLGGTLNGLNLPDDMICNQTQLMVIDGEADIDADSGYEIPTGFTAFSLNCGGEERVSGFQSTWYGSRPLTQEELAFLDTLNGLNGDFLNYPVEVPTFDDIQQYLQAISGGGNVNNSGGVTSGPASGQVDCSNFKPTSPLGTMPGTNVPFYWDAANGATSYIVRVYDSGGGVTGEYSTTAPQTSVVGNPGGKENLSWDVTAYVNGEVACTSARVGVLRDTVYETAPQQTTSSSTYQYCSPLGSVPACPANCTAIGYCGYYMYDTLCECT